MPHDTPRSIDLAYAAFDAFLSKSKLSLDQSLPSERTLAAQWQISQFAVNRAASGLICAGQLRRVGYKLFVNRVENAGTRAYRIAMIVHENGTLSKEFRRQLSLRNVSLTPLRYQSREDMHRHLRACLTAGVDGVLFRRLDVPWEWGHDIELLHKKHIPVVACDEAPAGQHMVAADYFAAATKLVQEFARQGHRDLVAVISPGRAIQSERVLGGYTSACRALGLNDSATQFTSVAVEHPGSAHAAVVEIRQRFPRATAILLGDSILFPLLARALEAMRLKIPADLSFATIDEPPEVRAFKPGITCAIFDPLLAWLLSLDVLISLIRNEHRVGPGAAIVRVYLEPEIRRRGSIAPIGPSLIPGPVILPFAAMAPWPEHADERKSRARHTWLNAYPLAARNDTPAPWLALDLRSVANQPYQRRFGFLGDLPLKQFPPGRPKIHGVPFAVIDERKNDGRGVIALRSAHDTSAVKQRLPDSLSIPVHDRAAAVYWLHACGWGDLVQPFATYTIEYEDDATQDIPLICASTDAAAGNGSANIQDWWPLVAQFNWEHARHVVITADGDPFLYERYLYTLEWINPRPEVPVRAIHLRSDVRQETKLALFAITVLRL